MSELTKRVLFALPAAAAMLIITWWGGYAFEFLLALITLLTIWEIHRILTQMGTADLFPLSMLITFFAWFYTDIPILVIYAFSVLGILLTITALINIHLDISKQWFATLFNGMYAPVGFLMIIAIRNLGSDMDGFWLILTFFLMTWGNDVFAYFGGKKFGKNKLVPNISPNKTVEGFGFGFLGAAVGFIIVFLITDSYPVPFWSIIPAIITISTLGPAGDIVASRLKRLADVKDSSTLLPGHGGFFDRFDSMILSAPFIYFLFFLLM